MADLEIKIGGDGSEAVSELEAVRIEAKRTGDAFSDVARQLDSIRFSGDTAGAALLRLEDISRAQLEAFERFGKAGDSASAGLKKAENSADSFARAWRETSRELRSEVLEEIIGDGSIANELVKAFDKLPASARVAALGIGAAFLTAAGSIAVLALATNQVFDTAGKVGSKSAKDFQEFEKSVKAAGFEVTELDRKLGQSITTAAGRVKSALDGIFVGILRQSGPELLQLLRQVEQSLRDFQPIADAIGKALSLGFLLATATLRGLKAEIDAIRNSGFVDNFQRLVTPGVALAETGGKIAEEFGKARAELDKLKLNDATFDGTGSAKRNADLRNEIELLQVRADAAQRAADVELAEVERLRNARAIGAEQAAARIVAAERSVLAAKLAVIAAERDIVGQDGETTGQANVRRAQLREQELQLLSDFNERTKAIRNDQLQSESEAINQSLENARKAAQAKIRVEQELLQIALDIREIRAQTQQQLLDTDRGVVGNERDEIARQQALDAERARLRSARTQADIQAQRDDLQFAELSSDERLQIEQRLTEALIQERTRLRDELLKIRIDARAEDLQTQGFNEADSNSIAAFEAAIERQTTASEKLKISLRNTALELSKTIPTGAALAAQSFRVLSTAMAQSIAAFVSGQATLRQALGQITKAIFDQLAQVALAKGAEQFAWALSDLAIGNYGGAAKHFAAGAAWSALGGVVGAVGAAVAGGGGGGGQGGLSQQLTGTDRNGEPREERTTFRDGRGLARAQTLVVRLETDWAANVKGVEYGVKTSYNDGGTVRKLIEAETRGIAAE